MLVSCNSTVSAEHASGPACAGAGASVPQAALSTPVPVPESGSGSGGASSSPDETVHPTSPMPTTPRKVRLRMSVLEVRPVADDARVHARRVDVLVVRRDQPGR